MKSAQHHYAQTAYEGIMKVKDKAEMGTNTAFVHEYGQLCHRFPSLVLTNGLRLAVAFFKAKGAGEKSGSVFLLYLRHIGQAVGHDFGGDGECALPQNAEYLHLSRKVLSASVWFKRYAEAVLKVEQGADVKLVDEGLEDAVEEDRP